MVIIANLKNLDSLLPCEVCSLNYMKPGVVPLVSKLSLNFQACVMQFDVTNKGTFNLENLNKYVIIHLKLS